MIKRLNLSVAVPQVTGRLEGKEYAAVVAFPGSIQLEDWVLNSNYPPKEITWLKPRGLLTSAPPKVE